MTTKTKTKRAPKEVATAYLMIPTADDPDHFGFDTTANRLVAYRLLREPCVGAFYFEDTGADEYDHFMVYRLGPNGKEPFDLLDPRHPKRDPGWQELTEALKGASFVLTGSRGAGDDYRVELTHDGKLDVDMGQAKATLFEL